MKSYKLFFISLIMSVAPAAANDTLTTDQLEILITNNTLYITVSEGSPGTPNGGVAVIFYGQDGIAKALLPSGSKCVGTWKIFETEYCINWENGPRNSCSTLVRLDDNFILVDTRAGNVRGEVSTISTGNSENL